MIDEKPIPGFAIAFLNCFAIVIIILDHLAHGRGGQFYFWLSILFLIIGTVAVSPWGERFR